jgi:hypothetical protein
MSLQLTITNAGLSAIAQAGTLGPVVISKVAIGSGSWTTAPTPAATALLAQIKQITPQGSSTPSPGVIHITAEDSSTDAYSVSEIGLYDSNNVLFAIAGGTAAYLTKYSASTALFSIDISLANVPVGTVTIGNANFTNPPATETTMGVAEIATTAEVTAGTDDTRIVTPSKLSAAGFVKKSGDTMTGDLNLAGISKTSNGYTKLPNGMILQWGTSSTTTANYAVGTITFPIAFPTACLNVQIGRKMPYYAGGGAAYESGILLNGNPTTTSFQFYVNWAGSQAGSPFWPIWVAIGY